MKNQKGPHWNVDPHDLSGELYRKYIKKEILGTLTRKNRQGQPDLYCYDCRKEHWGPCECAICGKTGHDEDECPELGNQDIEDPEMTPEYEKRYKPRKEKKEVKQHREKILLSTLGRHNTFTAHFVNKKGIVRKDVLLGRKC